MDSYPIPKGKAGFFHDGASALHYLIVGKGNPLVFIHSFNADLRMWGKQTSWFGKRFQVFCYDNYGAGKSSDATGLASPHHDLKNLFDFWEIGQAIIVGLSRGSGIAIDFALNYPLFVKALILASPVISGHQPSLDIVNNWHMTETALRKQDLEQAVELNLQMWVDGPKRSPTEVPGSVRELAREMTRENLSRLIRQKATPPVKNPAIHRLAEIQVPTLIVHGDYDSPHIEKLSLVLENEIKEAKRVSVPQVGHMVNMEVPKLFNDILNEFLQSYP